MTVARRVGQSLGAYLKAVLQNALIVTCVFIAGFAVAGVPWWALTGFVCGILNAVPHIGSLLALAVIVLVQFLAGKGWEGVLYAGGVWLGVQILEGFVLSPRAAGKSGVNPIASIVLVLAAGLLFGPIGAIFAVPVAAVLLIIYRATKGATPRSR